MKSCLTQIAVTLTVLASVFQAKAFKKVEGTEKFHDITLSQSVELEELDQVKLKSVAHGLRNKKVAFMNFQVYVGEVLMPQESTWTQKSSEFMAANPAGFQMTFLRDVPADKMLDAFQESFKENKVDTNSAPVKEFLTAVKKVGDLKDKDVFVIARKKDDKADKVVVLIAGKTKEVISGPSGWSDDILKIWGGKAADSGFEKLQKDLFKE